MANFNRCPRCGNIPSDGSRFCTICGLDLGVQLGMGVGNVQGGSGESYVYKDAYARYNMVIWICFSWNSDVAFSDTEHNL